jgi:hypothetical protein
MNPEYIPNFDFLDYEERELEDLDPSTVLPENERVKALAAIRKASKSGRKAVTMRLSNEVIAGDAVREVVNTLV